MLDASNNFRDQSVIWVSLKFESRPYVVAMLRRQNLRNWGETSTNSNEIFNNKQEL